MSRAFAQIWRYRVRPGRQSEFEARYGPNGDWARLFARASGYRSTELLRDRADPLGYATIDRWESERAYRAFHEQHEQAYRDLDALCGALMDVEERIGSFEEAG